MIVFSLNVVRAMLAQKRCLTAALRYKGVVVDGERPLRPRRARENGHYLVRFAWVVVSVDLNELV